jgi:hypothetical protein
MNRRQFHLSLLAAPVLALLGWRTAGKVGYMDYRRWWDEGRNERGDCVLLNGRDITYGCVWFNDETGQAWCMKMDRAGKFYMDPHNPDELAAEMLTGSIRVVRRA